MANIRQVAKEAGVSITTVSRVLSGDESFSVREETKRKVMDAVAKLGYKIPVREQDLIRLGCVMAMTSEKYSDPFFSEILSGIERGCATRGAVLSVLKTYTELDDARVLQELLDSGLDGVFLMERVPSDLLVQLKTHIPNIVFIDNDEADYDYDSVGFDHMAANKLAMECLLGHGYKRIAIISGSSPNEPLGDTIRMTTYRETLRKAGIEFDPELIKDCEWDLDICAEQTKELMSLPEPPDAIFAGSDSLASAVLGALYQMGIRCPEDVGLIGFNNIEMTAHMVPPLTTVRIRTKDIGEAAAQRIVDMVKGRGGCVRKILFPTEVVERGSLRDTNGRL